MIKWGKEGDDCKGVHIVSVHTVFEKIVLKLNIRGKE